MHSRGKILVIRGGAIGDFILTLPVFTALREMFPDTRLEVLGYPHIAGLASLGKLVDDVRSIEAQALAGFFARNGVLSEELCAYFASFNIIVSYLYDPEQIFQTNVGRCSKAQFIQGPHRPNETENIHAAEVFLKPLERLAIFGADPAPRLLLESKPATEGWIAVHPGSGSEKKNWPEQNWAELLSRLADGPDHRFLLIGGEAEGDKVRRLARLLPPSRVDAAYNIPLTELAQRLRSCSFFIGHDSGITHLAAAVGLRGLVLWGETNPEIWKPRSDNMKIVPAENGLAQLPVENVYDTLTRALKER